MIDFRYHIVSIVAVFLALALGLFLGSTTLQGSVLNSINHQVANVRAKNAQDNKMIRTLQGQLGRDNQMLEAVTPYAIDSSLVGDTVAIVSAPGTDSSVEGELIKILQESEAQVTAQVQLEPLLFDPTKSTLLQSLATQLKPAGLRLPVDSGTLAASDTVADVMAERPGRPAITAAAEQAVLQSMHQGGVLNVNGAIADVSPAKLVLILTPDATATPQAELSRDNNDMLAITKQFATHAVGVVLAGPANPVAPGDDVLKLARSGDPLPSNLATVDSIGTAGGQIASVLALVAVFNGEHGSFGLGSNPPLPAAAGSQ